MHQLQGHGVVSSSERIPIHWLEEWVCSDDRAEVIATLQRAALTKSLFEIEHRVARHRWKPEVDAIASGAAAGWAIEGWFGAVIDITSRKIAEQKRLEAEARQSFLLQLQDRLRSLTDPVQIQFEAARTIGEQLGANRVGYANTVDGEVLM